MTNGAEDAHPGVERALLRAAEDNGRLRVMVDSLPFVASYIDAGLRYRATNAAYRRWANDENDTHRGHTLAEVAGDDAFRELRPDIERALAGEPVEIEATVPFRDRVRTIRARYIPDRDSDGTVRGIVVFVEDVSETASIRSRVDQLNHELRDRVEEFEKLLQVLPVGIGIATDPSADDIRVNPSFAAMLGIKADFNASLNRFPVDARPFRVLDLEGKDVPAEEMPLQKVAATGETIRDLQLDVIRADGQRVRLLESVTPLQDESGAVRGAVGAFVDITALVHAREEAGLARARLQLLADAGRTFSRSLDYGEALDVAARLVVPGFADVCIIDLRRSDRIDRAVVVARSGLDGSFTERFRAATPEIGHPNDETARVIETGQPYFLPEVDSAVIPSHARSREHGALLRDFAAISGMTVPLAAAGVTFGAMTFLYGPGGRRYLDEDLDMALELGRRIGAWLERIRVIDELQRANQAKDEFLGLISHELRTPLTVLTGGIRVLSRTVNGGLDEERRELLRQMDGEGERMLAMVENLLTLARIEVADQPASEPLVLQRVVAGAVRDERVRNPQMPPVRESYAEALPLVFAEEASVRLVVRNLLENASKFGDRRGPIEVSLRAAADAPAVELRVCDRGPGVEPAELQRIFERFYRSPQTARLTRGSGLGLPLCRRLVDAMGGSISAGLREGGGLAVTVTLPVYDDAGHPG